MFTAAPFTTVKTRKQPKCPSTENGLKKMWRIYTMENYSTIKKNKIMPLAATWMDLAIYILSKVSQTEKDKLWYHLHVGSKKMVQMNIFTKHNWRHKCGKQIYL